MSRIETHRTFVYFKTFLPFSGLLPQASANVSGTLQPLARSFWGITR